MGDSERYRQHIDPRNAAIAPLKTVERGRRCQNCRRFEVGELATQAYKASRFRDLQVKAKEIIEREGYLPNLPPPGAPRKINRLGDADPHMAKFGENYDLGDQMVRKGMLGLCLVHAAVGDFVHMNYLCDQWQERVKPDGAEKSDELPEEARDRIYGED